MLNFKNACKDKKYKELILFFQQNSCFYLIFFAPSGDFVVSCWCCYLL